MKTFLREFLASFLGIIFGMIVLTLITVAIIASMGSGKPKTKPNSILKLTFGKAIPEHTNNVESDPASLDFSSMFGENIGLNDIRKLIAHAKDDANIKGIYLDLEGAPGGFATMKKLRESLDSFKAAGKFVISYSTAYSQKTYYLASAAEKVYVHPMGGLDFLGFAGQIMYYKGLMDKVGVKAQIYYAGRFKSATEPFRRSDMSPENRKQVSEYIGGAYRQYLEVIAISRKISVDSLYAMADKALIRNAKDAEKYGLVDGLRYKDEIIDDLRKRVGIADDKKKELEVVGLEKYYEINKDKIKKSKAKAKGSKIAVVYAEGSIVDGEGGQGSIGGDKYARIIRELRKDDDIKAIVLRVNSGGGSALASEIIWREIEKAKEKGIKVVTSMGDVAASGGYYIAANSNKIYAESNTITGSIGVFGMIPNTRELYEKHLGLTMDTIKTGRFSTMSSDGGMFYAFNEEEGKLITESIEEIYDIFKNRVSEGRTKAGVSMMNRGHVDTIAEGRVWLGNVAKEIGLVDELGGLDDALKAVAKLANLTDYKVVSYPKVKSFEENLFSFGKDDDKKAFISPEMIQDALSSSIFGEDFARLLKTIREIKNTKGAQARMPYEIIIR
jgi:protease IV